MAFMIILYYSMKCINTALLMLYDDSCQLGAGLSASRRAWERVSLHELL